MPEYIISFRTHGPSILSSFGEIGDASIRRGTDHSAGTGTIDFHIEAEHESDAKEIARNDLQLEGQKIADILSFIAGDGLTLGRFYDPIRAEGSMQQRVDSTTTIGDLIIRITDSIYESTDVTLSDDDHTRQALTWYNLGLSTETPEDKFVAFWTGLEALENSERVFPEDDEREEIYQEMKEIADEKLSEYPDYRRRIKQSMGHSRREFTTETLTRVLTSETDLSVSDVSDLSGLNTARNDIVHSGERVDEIDSKAETARKYLRKVLDSRLSDAYTEVLETDTVDLDIEPNRTYHPVIDKDEWLEIVFEGERGKELSKREIQKRAFALLPNIHEIAKIRPEDYSGWMEPLHAKPDDQYQYAPTPEWVTPEVDAIMTYLCQAGAVPPEAIARNSNDERRDVELDADRAAEICEELKQYHVVESEGEYYRCTLDGQNCVLGRVDPATLTEL